MASTHDIQELDVSSILATQILTWIDEDEVESKGYESNLACLSILLIHAVLVCTRGDINSLTHYLLTVFFISTQILIILI